MTKHEASKVAPFQLGLVIACEVLEGRPHFVVGEILGEPPAPFDFIKQINIFMVHGVTVTRQLPRSFFQRRRSIASSKSYAVATTLGRPSGIGRRTART